MKSQSLSTKLAFLAIIVLAAPSVFAVSIFCPELEGRYICDDGITTFQMAVYQSEKDLDQRYIFQSPGIPDQVILTDEKDRPYRAPFGLGTFSGRCEDNKLIVNFRLQDATGRTLNFQDVISHARGNLTRHRVSFAGSSGALNQRSVCRAIAQED